MKCVITYGTYDLLHFGHIHLLRRARALGDYLIVALSTDEFNAVKGKTSTFPYEVRKAYLEQLRCVDRIIPEDSWDQKNSDVVDHDVSVFAIGDDWRGKFDFLAERCEVVYLERTPGISSRMIKAMGL